MRYPSEGKPNIFAELSELPIPGAVWIIGILVIIVGVCLRLIGQNPDDSHTLA